MASMSTPSASATTAREMRLWKRLAGWAAAVGFLWIGFTFANAMSLMENVRAWPEVWKKHSFNGATLGLR